MNQRTKRCRIEFANEKLFDEFKNRADKIGLTPSQLNQLLIKSWLNDSTKLTIDFGADCFNGSNDQDQIISSSGQCNNYRPPLDPLDIETPD